MIINTMGIKYYMVLLINHNSMYSSYVKVTSQCS